MARRHRRLCGSEKGKLLRENDTNEETNGKNYKSKYTNYVYGIIRKQEIQHIKPATTATAAAAASLSAFEAQEFQNEYIDTNPL